MKHYWWQPFLIPFTLLGYVATLLVLPFYRPGAIQFYKGCIELFDRTPDSRTTTIWGRPGGQSWGIRVIWYNRRAGQAWAGLRIHERVHTLHGEWTNAIAHAVLVPLGFYLDGWDWGWLSIGSIVLSQAAFGILYGAHFLIEWARVGFKPSRWNDAYLRIWSERVAYRVQEEFERGGRDDAWGF